MMDLLSSFIGLIPVTIAQSLILSFVAIGIMLPFRILDFPDLSSEGAFPLGGVVTGVTVAAGFDPLLAIALAVFCGFLAGCTTAFIHLRFRINTLLAGILVLTMLYSINLRIMGRTNMALFTYESLFRNLGASWANDPYFKTLVVGVIVLGVLALLYAFFNTEKGMGMRAVGASPDMAEAQGISIWSMTIAGVGLASAFSALAGSLMAQSQGFADVGMGFGILINGLAALIIGEVIVGRKSIGRQLLAPVVGSVVYYQLISLCLAIGLQPGDLKLATGLFVLAMLAAPRLFGGSSTSIAGMKN